MKTIELKNENWFDFQENCRWHEERDQSPCKHICLKNNCTCDECYCQRIKQN